MLRKKKWYVDECFVREGRLYDRGYFIVEEEDQAWIEWHEPIEKGDVYEFPLNECFHENGKPIFQEDGAILGKLVAKTYWLWNEKGWIIDPDKAKRVFALKNCLLFPSPLEQKAKEQVLQLLSPYKSNDLCMEDKREEIDSLLKNELGIEFRWATKYEPANISARYDAYSFEKKGFLLLNPALDAIWLYEWWDGLAFGGAHVLDPQTITEIFLSEEHFVSLGEQVVWDGLTYVTVYRVLEVEEGFSKKTGDLFLAWRSYAQTRAGELSHDKGELILSLEELESFLEEIGEDPYLVIPQLYGITR
ncbi:UNVERIFIED_ORG: hypothetical protein BDK47_11660 [Anoxybacillus amylolyticus]